MSKGTIRGPSRLRFLDTGYHFIGQYQFRIGFSSFKAWSDWKIHRRPGVFHAVLGKLAIYLAKDLCGCRWSEDCQECCEHDYAAGEGYHCLNCGKDGSEDVMADAYDEYKDHMKYGGL